MLNVDNLNEIISFLEERLSIPLPGPEAQAIMAPSYREEYNSDNVSIIQSSVLLLLYPKNSIPHFVLMKRSSNLRKHSGQISFPGGKTDDSDTSYYHTAIRETYEELGIKHNYITLLGKLTPLYIPISNFMVNPFIAYSKKPLQFVGNIDEVEEIIEIPVSFLLTQKCIIRDCWEKDGKEYVRPFFSYEDYKVWGATAMIISEFRELLLGK